ncbi:glycosyltransferase family 2 protein [Clostridium taeniosporum]|uniref:Glycosyltransferase 2-like domain-containing protein n=1 Tax=Clostridium taeniosporum TaxID=394958 RepID=A0A1D7XNI0_9CLOT|nr:glycosyltransferase [Clostridium taeniosporum]AOR24750.1 hypothetical protein BGI42_13860 [Clostridium taeniosporum]
MIKILNPKISVIMSVYNNEKYLSQSIESILNQTYKNFEFIITNDFSKDNSLKIIKKYSELDNRIIIVNNKKNIGLTKSLNNMINICKGEYIARMDSDDIALHNRFEEQINILNKDNTIDIIFSDTILIDENNNKLCSSWRPKTVEKILKYLKLNNFIPHPTVIVKGSLLKEYRYNEEYWTGQDKELWIRLNKDNKKFYYLNKSLLLYRINPNSVRNKIQNQYYNLATQYINNNNKLGALRYIKNLKFKEKLIILIKLIVPFKLIFYKGLVLRRCNIRMRKNE